MTGIGWYFVEYMSQLDIDNVTEQDFEKALEGAKNLSLENKDDLRGAWDEAFSMVANP